METGELKWKDTKLRNGSPCPYCGNMLDGATSFEGQTPRQGNYSVCLVCASLLKFGKRMVLQKVSNEEIKMLDTKEPHFMEKIRHMQRIVRELDRRPPWEKPWEKLNAR